MTLLEVCMTLLDSLYDVAGSLYDVTGQSAASMAGLDHNNKL